MTIDEIRSRMQSAGSHWWDADSMRFFGTRFCSDTFQAGDSVWFVTSEQPPHSARGYTLRRYTISSGDISTEGELCGYSSRSGALAAARRAAGGDAAVASGKLTPTTPADELLRALALHGQCQGVTYGRVQTLRRLARSHQRLMEAYCNGREIYDAEGEPLPRLRRLRSGITEAAQAIGAKPVFGGDPRGCTVKLAVPSGYTNDFGREGVCVA